MAKCKYCGEEGYFFFNFVVLTPSGETESGVACADCIGEWFTETPEDVENMQISKVEDE